MWRRFPVLALLLALPIITAAAKKPETGFLDRTVVHEGATLRYQVYVPSNWDNKQKWPVILYLHGAGERGDDGILSTVIGIAHAIRRFKKPFPAVVVFPQCATGVWWTDPAMRARALKVLEQTVKEFNGDASRVYLTGLSMGGYGSWELAAQHPGKFAAVAVICGGIRRPAQARLSEIPAAIPAAGSAENPYAAVAGKIGETPVWIFHGDADPVVPVEESRQMNEALKAAGGDVRYSEYPGVNHNSWDRAYAEPELLAWLLAQRLK